jgi:hypothetical protein
VAAGTAPVLTCTRHTAMCGCSAWVQMIMRSIFHHARTSAVMAERQRRPGCGVAVGYRGGDVYLLLPHTLHTLQYWHGEALLCQASGHCAV